MAGKKRFNAALEGNNVLKTRIESYKHLSGIINFLLELSMHKPSNSTRKIA